MPENANIEVSQQLHEKGAEGSSPVGLDLLEIVEAVLLAFVTIATAWSGYQAARWDGKNALYYGEASRFRTKANKLATLGGQQRLYDITTFNSWLQATASGQRTLAQLFQRRFTPGYRVAFNAWLKTNPFRNPHAPPGPIFMSQYRNVQLEQSDALEAKASATFERGTAARETADQYVRDTLFFASILFLVAIGQRFKVPFVRRTLLGLAFVLLLIALYALTTLPVA